MKSINLIKKNIMQGICSLRFRIKFNFRNKIGKIISKLFLFILKLKRVKTKKFFYKLFIYSSEFQKRLTDIIIINDFKNNKRFEFHSKNLGFTFTGETDNSKNLNQIKNTYDFIKCILLNKLDIPACIYISHISFWHFPNPLHHGFFLALARITSIIYIDDGNSGTIQNNIIQQLNLCPSPNKILSYNYLNNKKDFEKLISFNLYLHNYIFCETQFRESNTELNKSLLIISSKALDYQFIKNKIKFDYSEFKNINYIPHPRKHKNDDELLKNLNNINTKDLERYIFLNSPKISEIIIGISSTTFFLIEMILRKKININLNIYLKNNTYINIYKKELISFINYCKNTNLCSDIRLDGEKV